MDIPTLLSALREHKARTGKTWREISDESGIGLSSLTKIVTREPESVDPKYSTVEKIITFLQHQKAA
ncbi:hypothetical protein [Allohahella sp. A8]|uniref:hypothetical protein n=1 Tax=Allohahella sp. A8 TaxID=3141461 RepID=UPI003A8002D1